MPNSKLFNYLFDRFVLFLLLFTFLVCVDEGLKNELYYVLAALAGAVAILVAKKIN